MIKESAERAKRIKEEKIAKIAIKHVAEKLTKEINKTILRESFKVKEPEITVNPGETYVYMEPALSIGLFFTILRLIPEKNAVEVIIDSNPNNKVIMCQDDLLKCHKVDPTGEN